MNGNPKKKKILFIINPISGVKHNTEIEDLVEEYLDKEKFEFHFQYTKYKGHATEISLQAVKNGIDVIVAAGGDGSINEIARATKNSDTALGIIPKGSGNGLAHHLQIPFRISKAIEVINKCKIRKIDTLDINGEICVSIAGVGFDALVAKEFEKNKKRGFGAYFKIILKEYVSYKPRKYKINIDGKKFKEKALFVSFANSNQFGYNATISPNARADDGLIDVCIIRKIPLASVVFLANLMFLKQIDKTPYIQIIQGKNITVSRKKDTNVNVDGENVTTKKKLKITIHPLSLNVIVP